MAVPRRCGFPIPVSLIAVALAAACATPSRRLSTRQVEDPITLPRRLMSVTDHLSGTLSDENGDRQLHGQQAHVRYGLTDRITLDNFTAVSVAIMDDVPQGHAPTGVASACSPFGLTIDGGLAGFAISDVQGVVAIATAGVSVQKHLGRSLLLDGGIHWRGWWRARDVERASLGAHVGLMRQLTDHVAVRFGVYDLVWTDTFAPSRDWATITWGAEPDLRYRPFHWFSLGVGLALEKVTRRSRPVAIPPFEPIPAPVDRPWLSVWGSVWAYFYW